MVDLYIIIYAPIAPSKRDPTAYFMVDRKLLASGRSPLPPPKIFANCDYPNIRQISKYPNIQISLQISS
jgi:hypothetical protein